MLSVEPLAREPAAEASAKLGAEVSFDFDALWAHEHVGRDALVKALAAAGVDVGNALGIAGLE